MTQQTILEEPDCGLFFHVPKKPIFALELLPALLTFGTVDVGVRSAEQTLILRNVGEQTIPIKEIIATGDYLITYPVVRELLPGRTIEISVVFFPNQGGFSTGGVYVNGQQAIGKAFSEALGFGAIEVPAVPGITIADGTIGTGVPGSWINYIDAKFNKNEAAILQEAIVRANAVSALATLTTTLSARVDTNQATVNQKFAAQANTNEAIASAITELTAQTQTANARITEESRVRAAQNEASAERTTRIEASLPNLASVASLEDSVRASVSRDQAQVLRITKMEARMPAGEGGLATSANITEVNEVIVTKDEARATQINTVEASLTSTQQNGANLIMNPKFDNGAKNWSLGVNWSIVAEGEAGDNCLKMLNAMASSARPNPDRYPVRATQVWRLRVLAKRSVDFNGSATGSQLRISRGGTVTVPEMSISMNTFTTSWAVYEKTWTVPAGVTNITLAMVRDNSAGQIWLDNFELTNISEVSEIRALIKTTNEAIVTTTDALASQITIIKATMNGNIAAIQNEATARANALYTLGQTVAQIKTNWGPEIAAAIRDERTVWTNATDALSTRIATLTAKVGPYEAKITSLESVTASLTGRVEAIWGFKMEAGNYVSGITAKNDGSSSNIMLLFDRFTLAQNVGGTLYQPFIIGLVNGQAQVGIQGSLIVDGTIRASAISTDRLSALSSRLGSITSGQLSIYEDGFGGTGYIRSGVKNYLDGQNGWIMWRTNDGGHGLEFYMGSNNYLRMQSNGTFIIQSPGFYLDHTGNVSISAANVVGTNQIKAGAVSSRMSASGNSSTGQYIDAGDQGGICITIGRVVAKSDAASVDLGVVITVDGQKMIDTTVTAAAGAGWINASFPTFTNIGSGGRYISVVVTNYSNQNIPIFTEIAAAVIKR